MAMYAKNAKPDMPANVIFPSKRAANTIASKNAAIAKAIH